MKYDGAQDSGPSWRSRTRNYILTKAPDAGAVLDLVEAHEGVPAFCVHVPLRWLAHMHWSASNKSLKSCGGT